jgi:O-antigen ligase
MALVLVGVITVAAPSRGSEMSFDESSAQSRIQSWAEGWAMLKAHPLTGVGYDQYTEYHHAVAHNSFVHTFAELGLLGALCFVGIFYWYFKGLALIPKSNAEFAPWRRALITSAVGTLACSWFLSRQYIPVLYALVALGACAADQQVATDNRPKLQMGGVDATTIAGVTIALLVTVYISIRTMAIWGG